MILEEELKRQKINNEAAKKEASLLTAQKEKDIASRIEKEKQEQSLKQQKTNMRTGLLSIIAAAAGVIFFYRGRQRKLKNEMALQKAAESVKEAEFKTKLNDVSFAALRSQMNPHFIFNCLNSIKLYTEENNKEAASEYLGKFSQLIRNMLNNTRSERILLKDEIESLKLYLEMEAMRFKSKLQWQVIVDDTVDMDFIEIPPLMVQPYVENAIWHGLMHKPDGGLVQVIVKQTGNDLVEISIEDNGIGRKKSQELKRGRQDIHQSHGTKITDERIALINSKYKSNASVTILDLNSEDETAAGTKVILKIPVL